MSRETANDQLASWVERQLALLIGHKPAMQAQSASEQPVRIDWFSPDDE